MEVPFPLLQRVAELSDEILRRSLTHLQATEFLYEARLFPELEYSFKHALLHDVAYMSLLERQRDLEAISGVGTVRAREIREGLRRLQEHNLVDRYLQL